MQDLVISDTSCLILLTKIGQIDLLQKTYGTVLIPSEVFSEYNRQARIPLPNWITVLKPRSESLSKFHLPHLDAGEQAAFALASEHPGSLLIVDDKEARKIAKQLGFRTTGTIGVLLASKESGHISAIRPLIEKISGTNFRVSPDLIRQALFEAGEL